MSNSNISVTLSLLLFVLLQYFSLTECGNVAERIVGGALTTVDKRKYLVYLMYNGAFYCGSTLVSTRHVVTAEHCVVDKAAPDITAVGGTSFLSSGGVRCVGEKIFHSPRFTKFTLDMDVAVIKLKSAMEGTNIHAITLCSKPLTVGKKIVVSGWGKTQESSVFVPNQMRTVSLTILGKQKCTQKFKRLKTLTGTMFCASVPGKKDACSGDSGGPAVFNGEFCGIVSFGVGCANPKYPGVYTSVYAVRDFIRNAMNN